MSLQTLRRVLRRAAFVPAAFLAAIGAFAGAEPSPVSADDTLEIGRSAQGRPIEITCFASDDPADNEVILIVGGIHTGHEENTVDLSHELMDDFARGRLVASRDLTVCILPNLNPDGSALGVHTNARRVDLNRNWPSEEWRTDAWHPSTGAVSGGSAPLSEPESKALYTFIDMVKPSAILVLHCCGSLVEANGEPDAVFMARRYARAAGFAYLDTWDFYDISGEFIDSMDELRVPAMDIELRASDATDVDDHRAGIRAVMDYFSNPVR